MAAVRRATVEALSIGAPPPELRLPRPVPFAQGTPRAPRGAAFALYAEAGPEAVMRAHDGAVRAVLDGGREARVGLARVRGGRLGIDLRQLTHPSASPGSPGEREQIARTPRVVPLAALAGRAQIKSIVCDWRHRDAEFARLTAVTEQQLAAGERTALSAFDAFARPVAPATLLAMARSWAADARVRLLALLNDPAAPEIVRATALQLLAARRAQGDEAIFAAGLEGDEPLLALAAIEALAELPPERRAELLQRYLDDERLALRIAAARSLLTARAALSPRRQADLDRVLDEFLATQAFNSDRPEGLGGIDVRATDAAAIRKAARTCDLLKDENVVYLGGLRITLVE